MVHMFLYVLYRQTFLHERKIILLQHLCEQILDIPYIYVQGHCHTAARLYDAGSAAYV